MEEYRLKKSAHPFFADKLKNEIRTLDFWKERFISIDALEKSGFVNVEYGIDQGGGRRDLCSWNDKEGSKVFMTINFPKATSRDNTLIKKHVNILLREIQDLVAKEMEDILNE